MLSLIFLKHLLVVGKKIKTVAFRILVHFAMVCIFMCHVFLQYDFTMMGGCLFVGLIVLLCFGFLSIFFYSRVSNSS